MDAFGYFFTALGFLNALLFLLGLFFGWLIWGRRSKVNINGAGNTQLQADLDAAKLKVKELEAKNSRLKAVDISGDLDVLQGDLDAANLKIKDLEAKSGDNRDAGVKLVALTSTLDAANLRIKDLESSAGADGEAEAKLSALQADLGASEAKVKELEAAVGANGETTAELERLKADLATCGGARAELEEKLALCNEKCSGLEAEAGKLSGDLDSANADLDVINAQAEELRLKNMSFFSGEIASGKLREDEKYGLLYNEAPEEADDLTKIKGVAKVLNKTLNDYGVFKYRQIALWTPQICEDFSERIAFKGRVERDNWIDQCKEFHEDKYGEKI